MERNTVLVSIMDFFCNSSYWGIKLLAGGPDLTRMSLLDLGSAH